MSVLFILTSNHARILGLFISTIRTSEYVVSTLGRSAINPKPNSLDFIFILLATLRSCLSDSIDSDNTLNVV